MYRFVHDLKISIIGAGKTFLLISLYDLKQANMLTLDQAWVAWPLLSHWRRKTSEALMSASLPLAWAPLTPVFILPQHGACSQPLGRLGGDPKGGCGGRCHKYPGFVLLMLTLFTRR